MNKILRISSFIFGAILLAVSGYYLLITLGILIWSMCAKNISEILLRGGDFYYLTSFYIVNFVMGLLYLRFSFNYFQENKFIKWLLFLFVGILTGYLTAIILTMFEENSFLKTLVIIKSIVIIWLIELIIYKIFKKRKLT